VIIWHWWIKEVLFLLSLIDYLGLTICVDRRNILSADFVEEAPSHGNKQWLFSRKVT
jgi:hypothetical protein